MTELSLFLKFSLYFLDKYHKLLLLNGSNGHAWALPGLCEPRWGMESRTINSLEKLLRRMR